jgi:hypothetical protein
MHDVDAGRFAQQQSEEMRQAAHGGAAEVGCRGWP